MTDDEMTDFVSGIRNVVRNAPEPLLFLTDNRRSDVWPQDAYDKFVWAMRMDNPNVLAVHRPAGPPDAVTTEALALVTCSSAGRLAVVGLGSFRMLSSVPVGAGRCAMSQATNWPRIIRVYFGRRCFCMTPIPAASGCRSLCSTPSGTW